MLGLDRRLHERFLDRGVLGRGVEQHAELTVERFLAGQWRYRVEHRAELVEELLGHDPFRLAAALGLRPGDRRRLRPVLGLHLFVEVLERVEDDLVDRGLNGLAVLRRVFHEDAGNGVGQRGGAADDRFDAGRLVAFHFGPTSR